MLSKIYSMCKQGKQEKAFQFPVKTANKAGNVPNNYCLYQAIFSILYWKCSEYVGDADFGELWGSTPPNPVRCPEYSTIFLWILLLQAIIIFFTKTGWLYEGGNYFKYFPLQVMLWVFWLIIPLNNKNNHIITSNKLNMG